MDTEFVDHQDRHLPDESATNPIGLRCGTLVALLLLAGMSPQRRRAVPARRNAARSGAFNCRI